MNPNHEVISDFLDGEAFEPRALGEALADPAGRDLLIDFVVLRYAAQADERVDGCRAPRAPASEPSSPGGRRCARRSRWRISVRSETSRTRFDAAAGTDACRSGRLAERAGGECEMKPCVIALTIVLLQFGSSWRAGAQGVEGLRIVVRGSIGRADGGDRRSTGGFIDPDLPSGDTTTMAFSRLEGQCGTGVSPRPARRRWTSQRRHDEKGLQRMDGSGHSNQTRR